MKVLAVTSAARMASLPNVPTMTEVGHPSVDVNSFVAVFAQAKTDPAILDRLNREIIKALGSPPAKELFHKLGAVPMVMTPTEGQAG